ncbi:hypothetical protein CVIRNUC_003494 [Coccomyxa viridis]|uniref:Uncharacterized protein n=1 Tax=Coccomyxa viridis TaxID=1274662 RepID=A0AAV1I331_9CHLO|nr:hypothetical protein CVIRNUC_003494 [Coccomyxa viridis]
MPVQLWDAIKSPRVEINTAQLLRMAFVKDYHKDFLEDVKKQVKDYYDVRRDNRDKEPPQLLLRNVRKFGVISDLCSHSLQQARTLLKGPTSNLVVFSSVKELLKSSGDKGSDEQVQGVISLIEDFCSFSDPSLDVVKQLEDGLEMIVGKLAALVKQFNDSSSQGAKYDDLVKCQNFFFDLKITVASQRMRMFSLSDDSVMSKVRELYLELMRLVEVERANRTVTQVRLQKIADLLIAMSDVCKDANQVASRSPLVERIKGVLRSVRELRELAEQLNGSIKPDERVSESFVIPVLHKLAMTPALGSIHSKNEICRTTEAYLLALGDSVEDSLAVYRSLVEFFKSESSATKAADERRLSRAVDDDRVSSLIRNIQNREASILQGSRPSVKSVPEKQHMIVLEMIGASLAGLLSDLVFVTIDGDTNMYRIDFHIKTKREPSTTSSLLLNTPKLDDAYVDFARAGFLARVKERQRLSMRMDVFRLIFQKSFLACMTVIVPGQKDPLRFMHEILRRDNSNWVACDDLDMQLDQKELAEELQERFGRLNKDEELLAILTTYREEGDYLKQAPFTLVLQAATDCFLAMNAASNNALSYDSDTEFGQSVDWQHVVTSLRGSVCPDWYNDTMISEFLAGVIADESPDKRRRYVVYKHSLEQLGVRTWNILREAKKKLYSWSGGADSEMDAWQVRLADKWSQQWRLDFQLYLELTDINIFRLWSDKSRRLAADIRIPGWILQGKQSSG